MLSEPQTIEYTYFDIITGQFKDLHSVEKSAKFFPSHNSIGKLQDWLKLIEGLHQI